MRSLRHARKSEKGTSVLEFSLIGPLLLLMMLGAADFGRIFYHAVTLDHAAGSGAFYGAQSLLKCGDYAGIRQVTQNDAKDVGNVTANTAFFCGCPDGTRVDCVTGSCSGYGAPRVYVDAQALQNFQPLVRYPKIPNPVRVGRTAYMRVQ